MQAEEQKPKFPLDSECDDNLLNPVIEEVTNSNLELMDENIITPCLSFLNHSHHI